MASAVILAALAVLATPPHHAAAAQSPPTPWDGTNPFHCTIQDAGQGTTVPDPGADPYCVRFDKTNQNLTELGLIDFLTKEPARVGAAAPKCFYYQEDHWRGSVVQSDGRTGLYEFYGHYFYDRATGDGGAWVRDFRIAGQTFDPRTLPGFPAQYDQYYGPGTGGVITHNDVPADPGCAAKANQAPGTVYAVRPPSCLHSGGVIARSHIGPVSLGMAESRVRAKLGRPGSTRGGFLRYCVASGGELVIKEQGRRTVLVIVTSRRFKLRAGQGRAISIGTSRRALRAAFPRADPELHLGHTTVWLIPHGSRRGGTVLVGTKHGRIAFLGTFAPSAIPTDGALRTELRAAL